MINVVVDLSHHNTVSSFADVKAAGIAGVIHKATEGIGYQDPTYQSRKTDALAAGLLWGAYHFGTGSDPIQQAEYFLSIVKPGPSDLLVLDLEENPNATSMTLAQAEQFLTHIQSATGRWPGLYGGSYVKQLVGNSSNQTLANCWFWLAQYGSDAIVPPVWPTWTMWQYTNGTSGPEPHSVNGIGNCDRDKFNGSMEELTKLWNQVSEPEKEKSLCRYPVAQPNSTLLSTLQCKNGNRLDIYDTRVLSMILDKLV